MIDYVYDLTDWETEGLLAIVIRCLYSSDPGVSFLTHVSDPMQVGVANHPPGHVVQPHTHRPNPRRVTLTQEVILVRSGWGTLTVYNSQGTAVRVVRVYSGDTVVLLKGGHGLVAGDAGISFLECKTGPYLGRDLDKIDLEPR